MYKQYSSLINKVVVNRHYKDIGIQKELSTKFNDNGFVTLPGFFPAEIFSGLQDEAQRIAPARVAKNFTMPGYDTPRQLSVISGEQILRSSFFIPSLYINAEVASALSAITGSKLYNVDHKEEFMVINYLESNASTHGWHLDDPRFALVVILDAPECYQGGSLEIIKNWKSYCDENSFDPLFDTNRAVESAREDDLVTKIHHNTGDAYLLNAGDCLHRVTPVQGEAKRTVLNMAFDSRPVVKFGETAEILYGNSTTPKHHKEVQSV
ncbi:HalD/BesD family halogenase [Psychromonas sp. Urea-02u-13]|uniref:HalD/BesD family halogenase n=1 Tax=Psychromonas sp. Urea-02u-13 TaxID=2058326 RepID=UPI000C320ABB|nr:hypothetical protein [Psychromonas sp. Urea-02u-13]PKG37878.1 hypothetical protein CXF74_16460 [Psychromonas sp. Urea-02u-13]